MVLPGFKKEFFIIRRELQHHTHQFHSVPELFCFQVRFYRPLVLVDGVRLIKGDQMFIKHLLSASFKGDFRIHVGLFTCQRIDVVFCGLPVHSCRFVATLFVQAFGSAAGQQEQQERQGKSMGGKMKEYLFMMKANIMGYKFQN